MASAARDAESPDPRINAALQQYLERVDRGDSIDVERFLAEHREIADELRSFIASSEELTRQAQLNADEALKVSTQRSVRATHIEKSAAAPSLPETFGRYRVLKLLGRGAMGAVYLAQDTHLGRQVALKIPNFADEPSDELMQRFYLEARTAATLRSPHICPVYDVGEIDGQHYISMAYIAGRPLADLLKAGGAQPERQVLTLARKLALALQQAHDQGIVHRDLKPGNVMIDAKGEPIIMDFGLACRVSQDTARLTQHGVIIGSPAYMSPEQVDGDPRKLTPAADQYSLGVMLYELLCGEPPFKGTLSAVIGQIGSAAPAPLRKLRPELDPRTEALVLKMMSKPPQHRLPSMTAVADEALKILKEPPKPAAAETKPPQATSVSNLEEQRRVKEFVKQGELGAALEALKPLLAAPDQKLTEWAKQQSAQIQQEQQHSQNELPTLLTLSHQLMRKHDYAEVRSVLAKIPQSVRTQEVQDLLSDASDKDDQCQLLLADIETAIRKQFPKELPGLVKQFLKLKPGHQSMQALAAELKQYGPERAIQMHRGQQKFLDPAGRTINPKHIALFAGGLLALCAAVYFAVITFQTARGTVVIEVHDPTVTVNFANDEVTLSTGQESFKLKTTEKRTLQIEINGVTVDSATQQITVAKNETKLVSVRLLADGTPDVQIKSEYQQLATPKPRDRNGPGTSPANVAATSPEENWTKLFNGKDLTGWAPRNENTWTVRDGAIAIEPARMKENEFLKTAESYKDFELQLQYRLLNEGLAAVWFRENLSAFGPNVQLGWFTPEGESKRNVTGTLFAQWGNPLQQAVLATPTEDQQKTLQQADQSRDWNDLHVRCEGNRIVVKVNGMQTADYTDKDSRFPRTGKVALFAAKYAKPSAEFRNIRLRDLSTSSAASSDGWVDLLAPIDFPTVSSSTRNWERDGTRVLATTEGKPESGRIYAVLTPPQMITGDYDLEVEFLYRETGPVQFQLPLNETHVTFSVIEGRGTELHWIDDKFELNLPPPIPYGNPRLDAASGAAHHLAVSVRHQGENVSVDTKLDGSPAGNFSGPRSRLSSHASTQPVRNRLKMVSSFSEKGADRWFELQSARLRFVNPAPTPVATTPSTKGAPEKSSPRVLFVDEYDRASYTKPDDLSKNPKHTWGIRDGVWFDQTLEPSYYRGYLEGGSYSGFSCELLGRIMADNSESRGSVVMHLVSGNRGLQVRIDGSGALFVEPSTFTTEAYPEGPWIGPIVNRAIHPGGKDFNKIRLDVRKRRLEIFVNSVRVCDPLEFHQDLTPAKIGLGVDCRASGVRAEFDRVEIRTLQASAADAAAPKAIQFQETGSMVLADGTICYEGTVLKASEVSGGSAYPQLDMAYQFQGLWTNDRQLFWNGPKTGDNLALDLPIETAGQYQLIAGFTVAPDYGRIKLALDGKPLYGDKPIDLFDRQVQPAKPLDLGTIQISRGKKRLTMTVLGRNRASKGFSVGLDELRLVPVREPLDESKLTLLLDVDFSKGAQGFPTYDWDKMTTAMVDGEWQYLGKAGGAWFTGGFPEGWAQPHRNFVFEAEARFATAKLGSWGLRFCDKPLRHIDFCVGSDRQVSLWHFQEGQKEQYAALLQPSPAMRAATAFNTVRLEFVDSVGQVFVNNQFAGQAKFDGYEATPATMYLYPNETPLDVRFRRIRLWHVK